MEEKYQEANNDLSNNNQSVQTNNQSHQLSQKQLKIQQLKKWMIQKGCIIHPHVQIPSFVNGFQGVGTTAILPPKTVVIAVPSSLILTVTKCYKDPQLKSIFVKNDDLFDYEASDDAQFNVLCVFLMYHKLNIQTSPWRVYLETIGQPETAIDWEDKMLKGLNKSAIQQVLHIRIQCDKLRDTLSEYLKKTKQFAKHSLQQIKECFNYCYRAVMTRCFGYYFGQASLIPVADLINHGCQVVDHQLINIRYEKGLQFCQSYKQKSDKIDCNLLGIKRGSGIQLPFRQRFLITNGLIQQKIQTLINLNRQQIDRLILQYNKKLFQQENIQITDLNFCQEDNSQDNDTDIDEQNQREIELQRLQLEELEQIQNFKKYYNEIKVETYKQVEDRFDKYEKELNKQENQTNNSNNQQGQTVQSRNDMFIKGKIYQTPQQPQYQDNQEDWEDQDATKQQNNKSNKMEQKKQIINQTINTSIKPQQLSKQSQSTTNKSSKNQSLFFDQQNLNKQSSKNTSSRPNQKAIVPIQMVDSSQSQSQDDQQWGLQPDSYFTLSTSSAVGANKQLYNSYGSRTNKFLLIWYGFCYRNNLFDSVSLRLHVQFHKTLPEAKQIVLDTYIGGQGLTFRKNEKQVVKGNEVSRQFRLKLTKYCTKLLTFLRLYLLDYYKGSDLYKICVTIPSSVQFELFLLNYYREVIVTLYQRYPIQIINELKQQLNSQQFSSDDKQKIRFKIIYLEQQRKILDQNLDTADCMIKVWERIKKNKQNQNSKQRLEQFNKSFYKDFTTYQLRKMQPYLVSIKKNFPYILYQQNKQQK